MLYNAPFGSSDANAPYVNGDPSVGRAGSIPPASSVEYDQREIVEVINQANVRGYTDFTGTACAPPANTDLTQLRKAIEGYAQSLVIDAPVTYTVHGTGANFPDLITAMAFLSRRRITNNGSVTLQIAGASTGSAQQFTYTSSVLINHPNIGRIVIQGAPLIGAPVQGSDFQFTGLANRSVDAAAQLTMLRGRYATELHFTGGANIQINGSLGVGLSSTSPGLQNLLVTGDRSATVGGGVIFNNALVNVGNVSVHGFGGDGIVSNNGFIRTQANVSSTFNTGSGFGVVGDLALGSTQTIACSNDLDGFRVSAGGTIRQPGSFIIYTKGNAGNGLNGLAGSSAVCNNSQFLNNGSAGVGATQSQISCTSSTFSGNVGPPLLANMFVGINATGSTGTLGCSPPANTFGNINCYITV
jgi:hypothetical protein